MTSPAKSPSPHGPPLWVQVLSMAWKAPATLNRAMLRPSASTTLPVPGATSFASATFTSLDMAFPPVSVMRRPTIWQQLRTGGFVAGSGWRRPLSDLQPAGVQLPAQVAGVFEELGEFFLAGAGRNLGGGAGQPLRLGFGVGDGHAEHLQQLAGVVVHGLPPSSRT